MFDWVLNTPVVCHAKHKNVGQILKEQFSTSVEGPWNSSLVLNSKKKEHIFN